MANITEYIGISGNEVRFLGYLKQLPKQDGVIFTRSKSSKVKHYQIHYLNVEKDLTNITHELTSLYHYSRENHQKLLLCLIFETDISQEKIFYFQKLLTDTGGNNPIHKIVVTKDIYQTSLESVTPFDNQLRQIINSNNINISKQGQNLYFPYHLLDFQKALLKTLFTLQEPNKVIYLLGEKITDLDLAYLFKNILVDKNQLFQINAILPDRQISNEIIHQANLNQIEQDIKQTTEIEKDLKTIRDNQSEQITYITEDLVDIKPSKITHFYHTITNNLKRRLKAVYESKKTKAKQGIKSKVVAITTILISTYLISVGSYIYLNFQSYRHLKNSLGELKISNLAESVKEVDKSNRLKNLSEYFDWTVYPIGKIPGVNITRDLTNLQSFTTHLKDTLSNIHNAYILGEKLYQSFNQPNSNINISDTILAINSNLSQVYENLIQLNLQIQKGDIPKYLVPSLSQVGYSQELTDLSEQISETIKIIKYIPQLIPTTPNTNIAIAIQDQDELRSTGGIIRSILVLKLNNNHLEESNIYLQEDLDNQMYGETTADELLTKSTGQTHWYLRDLTLNPDYSKNAQRITWYLQNTLQITPNTIISVNQDFIKSFLDKTNKNTNLKINQTTGEEEHQNIKTAVQEIINLYKNNSLPLNQLAQTVTTELKKGNLLVYSNDPKTQEGLNNYPFSGTVQLRPCFQTLNQQTCLSETTYLNESNFSLAPINQLLSRQTIHQITINDQQINHQYLLNYHFDTEIKNFNRDYKLLYQLYAPKDSTLSAVIVDGQNLNLEFEASDSANLKKYNIPIALNLNEDHQVNITFNSPYPSNLNIESLSYSLTEIRQSGLTDDGFNLSINYPQHLSVKTLTHSADIKPSQVQIKLPTQNFTFGLSLKPF